MTESVLLYNFELEQPSFYDCKVLDGTVIVHFLPAAGVLTFNGGGDCKLTYISLVFTILAEGVLFSGYSYEAVQE